MLQNGHPDLDLPHIGLLPKSRALYDSLVWVLPIILILSYFRQRLTLPVDVAVVHDQSSLFNVTITISGVIKGNPPQGRGISMIQANGRSLTLRTW